MKNKCLWVLPKNIFPICDGARVANYALLKSMAKQFSSVDVAVFNELVSEAQDGEKYKSELAVDEVFFLNRASFTNKISKYLYYFWHFIKSPHLPVTTSYFQTNDLDKLIKLKQYDVIVFDCLHPFTGLSAESEAKIIYRAHNVEQDLWTSAIQNSKNPLKQMAFFWQGKLIEKLENKLLKAAHAIWAISSEDKTRFLTLDPYLKIELVPVSVEFKSREIKKIKNKTQLLFLGKLDWPPNKEGLTWFLEEIWPFVDKNKFELNIVGSGNGDWCKKYIPSTGLNFLGFIPDLQEIYNTMDISLVPVHFGSGTRIKVLECVAKNMPMLSTAMGVQGSGLGLEDYCHAETKIEWIAFFQNFNLELAQKKAENSFLKLSLQYSPAQVAERAIKSL